jgi:hypothetical protein
MSRFVAGSKAAERRLRKHAEAIEKLHTIAAQRQQADSRLTAQEEARHAAQARQWEAQTQADQIRAATRLPGATTLEAHEAAFASEQAAQKKSRPIATIVRSLRTTREERAAQETKPTPAPTAAPANIPCPIFTIGRTLTKAPRVTLHARCSGWWDAVVEDKTSMFTIPFYNVRPEPQEVAQAVREEITRRLANSQPKPRSTKAPAMLGQQPRETARIRRIERQLEGV